MPIPAQTAPVSALGPARCDLAAAMTAATGIGHGAATPAPQPASSPAGTDSGTLMPQGWPGSSSRIATALPTMAAPANASDAASSARSGSALIRCSCPWCRGRSGNVRLPVGDLAPGGRVTTEVTCLSESSHGRSSEQASSPVSAIVRQIRYPDLRCAPVAETTVKTHVACILPMLELRERAYAVVAYESGLIQPGSTTKNGIPGWYVSQNRTLRGTGGAGAGCPCRGEPTVSLAGYPGGAAQVPQRLISAATLPGRGRPRWPAAGLSPMCRRRGRWRRMRPPGR